MKVLGCTGGIGSGKTYISRIFAGMGIPVFHSDDKAKHIYYSNPRLLEKIAALLGEDVVVDGVLQRHLMASRIFNDRRLLDKVEQLVHPAVLEEFENWKKEVERDPEMKAGFVVLESAILLEKPLVRNVADKILTISAPLELRVERVMRRDDMSREKVMERILLQWDDSKREAMADFIIFADNKRALLPQVIAIVEAMTALKN